MYREAKKWREGLLTGHVGVVQTMRYRIAWDSDIIAMLCLVSGNRGLVSNPRDRWQWTPRESFSPSLVPQIVSGIGNNNSKINNTLFLYPRSYFILGLVFPQSWNWILKPLGYRPCIILSIAHYISTLYKIKSWIITIMKK